MQTSYLNESQARFAKRHGAEVGAMHKHGDAIKKYRAYFKIDTYKPWNASNWVTFTDPDKMLDFLGM